MVSDEARRADMEKIADLLRQHDAGPGWTVEHCDVTCGTYIYIYRAHFDSIRYFTRRLFDR